MDIDSIMHLLGCYLSTSYIYTGTCTNAASKLGTASTANTAWTYLRLLGTFDASPHTVSGGDTGKRVFRTQQDLC